MNWQAVCDELDRSVNNLVKEKENGKARYDVTAHIAAIIVLSRLSLALRIGLKSVEGGPAIGNKE